MLDTLYARLRQCGNPACSGKPFIEHSAFPAIDVDTNRCPASVGPGGRLIREAITSGQLTPGEAAAIGQASS